MKNDRHCFASRSAGRLGVVALLIAVCLGASAATAFAATFDPELIISNDNMRRANSMSANDIQAFLETQSGPLKSLVTVDHAGVKRKASMIIWQASSAWDISPKVMLTMLQKEQSLLTRTTLSKNTLNRAIGAGCPDSTTNRYPGFGNQMWNGARLLDSYGEGNPSFPYYYVGISKSVYGGQVHPKNLATFKLYVYNPSIGAKSPYGDLSAQAGSCSGNANFWLIYRRYFGSTFANPRMLPVYRLRNRCTGSYLYTASAAERYHLASTHRKSWKLDGVVFSVDSSVPSTATVPMYRFYNLKTHRYSFVTSQSTFTSRTSATGRLTWRYQGIAFRVVRTSQPRSAAVWRFQNRKTHAYLLTSSTATVKKLRSSQYSSLWRYQGISFYLPRI